MPVNIGGTIITGGTTVTVTDGSSNELYKQSSTGVVTKQKTSQGGDYLPMFNVGWSASEWTSIATGVVPFDGTTGSGYYNVGGCYNTSTYRFTAPWSGVYLFKVHIYIYGNTSTYSWYTHPFINVNGSTVTRRNMNYSPYRIRLYGLYSSYGQDTDMCDIVNLTAGDYVEQYNITSGTVQGYPPYSSWSGAYLGGTS